MDIYDKHASTWDAVHRIDEPTWQLLQHCVDKYKVQTCVEFGCGLSTLLLDLIGVQVTAFEDVPKYIHPKLEHLNQSSVVLYDDIFKLKLGSHYDMAFIDGPGSGITRKPVYQLVSDTDVLFVVCHDVWRQHEQACALRYFCGSKIIGSVMSKKIGLYSIALKIRR